LLLSLALLSTSVYVPTWADNKPHSTNKIEISKENAYYDENLKAYAVSFTINGDNTLNYLTESEVNTLNQLPISEVSTSKLPKLDEDLIVTPMVDYYEWYTFQKTSGPVKYVGARRKVSADFIAPPGGGSVSKNVSFSVSETYSAGVTTSGQKNVIQANAGFSWSVSASTATTYVVNLTAGQSGYLGFSPYYDKVSGTLKTYSNWDGLISSVSASGYSVRRTYDGEADGLYQFIFY